MPENEALWLPAKGAAFRRGPAPQTPPQAGELLVRTRAVAVNPVDRLIPVIGGFVYPWLSYPAILGSDVAGEVVAVGPGVTRFRVGDRVLGHAVGPEKASNRAAEGAFQSFVLLRESMAAPIPAPLSDAAAAVLPLGLSTAACALFEPDLLALRWPTAAAGAVGETILVWGGSTSVGCNAIQLATAAGYEVFATASPHNFDLLRRLGAVGVFDYRSPSVVPDLIAALRGRRMGGALAIGAGSAAASLRVLGALPGRRFVATATPPVSFDGVAAGRPRQLAPVLLRMALASGRLWLAARRRGVTLRMIWGGALLTTATGPMIYRDYLPRALAEGRHLAAPEPLLAGKGLDAIPAALEMQRRGVSARKVVVRL